MVEVPGYTIKERIVEEGFFPSFKADRISDKKPVLIMAYKIPYSSVSKITKFKLAHKIKGYPSENIVNVYEIEEVPDGIAVILEDFDGIPLTEILDDVKGDLNKFLNIAIQIANALEDLHAKSIIHENVKPANILINKTGKVKITNFIISPAVTREIKNIYDKDVIENILPYISPEQTGRMNRNVDYRTDFYSLGIVLYEMLTGRKPFISDDPLELIHSHIAREPVNPVELNRKIPEAISDIVMKLLQKTQEERYQGGYGLKYDLEKCLNQLSKTGKIKKFELGEKDVSEEFQIPQKLYGREREIESLMNSFESVSAGKREIMMVTGHSGIGKTVLVREIYKPVIKHRGYFVSGKYDQYTRNIPYNAIIQAFNDLTKQLLSESEERIKIWKEKILEAVGNNGQVMIDIIPEVELIIGKQPPVPKLGPAESQNRFNLIFQKFISVFTAKEHPLVLFLDDLHWVDLASLNLIKNLILNPETRYLYIIGAYRDNEVSPSHPLMLSLDEIKKTDAAVNSITLSLLEKKYVNQLIAETLNHNVKETSELSDLIYGKTAGNPFFVKQFLTTLHEEKMLNLDENFVWQWDIKKINQMPITDNVTDLMIGKINKLPPHAQKLLKIASCIGGKFDLETLSLVHERPEEKTFSDLDEAISEGLILTLDGIYGFSHDRIQEAIYSIVPDDEKIQIHYKIGNSVLKQTKKEDLMGKIFFICDQLNSGRELITDQQEKNELVELNLTAGKRAKESNAYASAVKYLTFGMELLPDDCWQKQYKLTYFLYLERAECEYLNTNFDEAEKLFDVILKKAEKRLEKVKVYEMKTLLYTNESKPVEAVKVGVEGLKLLGLKLSIKPGKREVLLEFVKIKWRLRNRKIEDLMHLPEMTNPEKKAIMNLLMIMAPSTFFISKDLYILTQLKMVNLSLKHGNTDVSSFAYGAYGFILGSGMGDFKAGFKFGQIAINLSEKFNNIYFIGKANFMVGCFITHWTRPAKTGIDYLMNSYQAGLESGDLMFAGYAIGHIIMRMTMKGDSLDNLYEVTEKHIGFLEQTKNYNEADYYIVVQRMVLNLKGKTWNRFSFSDDRYNEDKHVERMEQNKQQVSVHWYYIIKLQTLYIFENYSEAMKFALRSDKMIDVSLGLQQVPEHYFYYSLTLAALYPTAADREKKNYWKILSNNQKKMRKWDDNCPENFLHKYLLVAAEMARISGKDIEAGELYDKAIKSAGENEYIQNEAIACELAGKFYLEKGREKIAKTYMTDARSCYIEWGAKAKVKDLEEKYPGMLGREAGGGLEALDLETVLKASRVISGEILLDKLLINLMKIMIENAGAERGFLVMEKNDELFIEAEGAVDAGEVKVLESIPVDTSNALSSGIVNYVKRTGENVVLENAAKSGEFVSDPYVRENKIKSILCLPIVKQAKLLGILYLENNLAANAFTPERVEVLNVLCSQAAISLENAVLYDEMDLRVKERTRELAEANETKDRFFEIAAHDIGNKVMIVSNYAQLLSRDKKLKLNERQEKFIKTILGQSSGLGRLTGDIRELHNLATGGIEIEAGENNIIDIIKDSVESMKSGAEQNKIDLTEICPEKLPLVECDKSLIGRVMENLIGNAVKFTPENGKITVQAEKIKNEIVVSVEDTGIGISEENLKKIFNEFFQVDKKKYSGTGLGLAICREIIERHNGRTWVESGLNKGSKFIFTLPAVQ